jgi:folliculin-interacting protein 2
LLVLLINFNLVGSFISTLLTAVLTHHLGWVGTVAPLMTSNVRDNIAKNGNSNPFISKLLQEENFKLSEISKLYPYNALWAQLGDLYGAITNPVKLSKTIICGSEIHVKTIEKLLNVLTYFIRCSEIRRNCHTKIFDKENINKCVNQQVNTRRTAQSFQNSGRLRKSNGLARTATTVKQLSEMGADLELDDDLSDEIQLPENLPESDAETYRLLLKILKKNVMNDIPKVLAFRDSRFVKQELRIGNKSMDTGIEMTAKDKQFLSKYQKNLIGDHIKFTVTRPDGEADEIIELDDEDTDFKNQLDNFISLSNLITANSLGGAQTVMKMFWGKEPYKETLNLEQMKHLERISAAHQQQLLGENIEKLKTIPEVSDDGKGVVFVLGDNDRLVGLKTSPSLQTIQNFGDEVEVGPAFVTGAKKKTCKHNKKHSGVKFNFEKYPQIATNYMKSKNLEFHEFHDGFSAVEKGLKMEGEQMKSCGASTSHTMSDFPSTNTLQSQDETESEDECDVCRYGSNAHYLQTPSNATDLEFSGDQSHESDFLSPTARFTVSEAVTSQHFQFLQTLDENCELKSDDEDVKIVEIPILESVRAPSIQDDIMKPGFTSSLFTAAADHYIPDMILQVN